MSYSLGKDDSGTSLEDSRERIASYVTLVVYYLASTFLYTAFLILGFNWAELMLKKVQTSDKRLMSCNSLLTTIINIFIHTIQIIILLLMLIFILAKTPTIYFTVGYIVQLSFHASLSTFTPFFYIYYMLYVLYVLKRKILSKRDQVRCLVVFFFGKQN